MAIHKMQIKLDLYSRSLVEITRIGGKPHLFSGFALLFGALEPVATRYLNRKQASYDGNVFEGKGERGQNYMLFQLGTIPWAYTRRGQIKNKNKKFPSELINPKIVKSIEYVLA